MRGAGEGQYITSLSVCAISLSVSHSSLRLPVYHWNSNAEIPSVFDGKRREGHDGIRQSLTTSRRMLVLLWTIHGVTSFSFFLFLKPRRVVVALELVP